MEKDPDADQYAVLREHGTERAGTSSLLNIHDDGTFYCAACKSPLIAEKAKFESGTGWPSFYEPITKSAVKVAKDNSYGMERDEVLCAVCDGHLGSRIQRWPQTHRPAILHEWRCHDVSEEINLLSSVCYGPKTVNSKKCPSLGRCNGLVRGIFTKIGLVCVIFVYHWPPLIKAN